MKKFIEILNQIQAMDEGMMFRLYQALERMEYKYREIIMGGEKPPGYLYFIENGTVATYIIDDDERVVTGFRKGGDIIFDYKNLLSQTMSGEFIIANEPTTVYRMAFDKLQELLQAHPKFSRHISELVSRSVVEIEKRCNIISSSDPRVRYRRYMEAYGSLIYSVPRNQLCSYLRFSEPTLREVRRCIGELK